MTYRVYQWASGTVGCHAARAVLERSSLELAGLHVSSEAKRGQDVGTLLGGEPLGLTATGDVQAILDSDADVVIHAPLPSLIYGDKPEQDVDDFCTLLAAGKNVITLVGYMYPKVYGPELVDRLETACAAGGSSFHSTGLNPGWLGDLMPLTMSSLCQRVDHVHVLEISCFEAYPSPEIMFDSMGFGLEPDAFAVKNERQARWLNGLFSESVQLVADGIGLGVDEIVTEMETELAPEDLTVAAGVVKQGTVAGQHWRWSGREGGVEKIAHETVWRIHSSVAPGWASGANFIRFEGVPAMKLDFPGDFQFISDGMLATALHAVNAIPYVVEAKPGIQTFLDLPWILCRQ